MTAPRASALGMLCVFVAGCISVRDEPRLVVTPWPPSDKAATKTVAITVRGTQSFNGQETTPDAALVSRWQEAVLTAFHDAALFADFAPPGSAADYQVEVTVTNHSEINYAALALSSATATLVPAAAHDGYLVETRVRDARGNVVGTSRRSAGVTTWLEAFLLFVMPAAFPGTVATAVVADCTRATLSELHAQRVW